MTKADKPVVAPATPDPTTEPRPVRAQLDRYVSLMPFPLPYIAALYAALAIVTALVVIVAAWGR
jgi:hypothetical protein